MGKADELTEKYFGSLSDADQLKEESQASSSAEQLQDEASSLSGSAIDKGSPPQSHVLEMEMTDEFEENSPGPPSNADHTDDRNQILSNVEQLQADPRSLGSSPTDKGPPPESRHLLKMEETDELTEKFPGQFFDAARLDEKRQASSNAEQLQDEASSLSGSAIDKGSPPQSHVLEMEMTDEFAEKSLGPPSDADHTDDRNQTSSNAEQLQADPRSLGSSPTDKGPPPESRHLLKMEETDELTEKFPGQFSDAARLDEKRQASSNAEQLQDEASSLSGSAIDKGSPPQSHVLEMEMTDEFAEKSLGPPSDADHTDDRNQTSSNAEQLQADPRSLGSSPTDKGPPPESRHLLKMEETDELTEKFPGQFSDAARLDEKGQPPSNAEQLQDEASSLSGSAIDKGSPPQSHVLEMEMTDKFAEKSPGPLFDADHTDDRNQTSSNAEQLQADPRSLGSSPTDKGPPPESRHLLKMEETDELTEKFPGQFSDAARLDEKRQASSNAEQLQDEASTFGSSAIEKGTSSQSQHQFEMEKAYELAEKAPGPLSNADQLDEKSQASSNAEQLQDEASTFGSSAIEKGTSSQSQHQFEMEKAYELAEKAPGPLSNADQLDEKSQASSNAEQLQGEASSLSGSAIDKGSPPQSHVLEMEMTDEFAEKSLGPPSDADHTDDRNQTSSNAEQLQADPRSLGSSPTDKGPPPESRHLLKMEETDELTEKFPGQFSDAARLDERRQPASNAEQLQDEASSLSGSAIDKGSPPQSHVLEMEMTDEFAEKSPGPPSDVDHTDDRNQTSSNAEQLQADPLSLGSSPTDKGPPPESRHLLKMEETDELTEKFPGQFSDAARLDENRQASSNAEQLQDEASTFGSSAIEKGTSSQSQHQFEMEKADELAEKAPGPLSNADQLDEKSQASSNAEQLQGEASSLSGSAIDKGSPPQSHVLEMEMTDEFAEKSLGPPSDADHTDDRSQTSSNAEQLQADPRSLGSSPTDKGPPPESRHLLKMEETDELTEKFPGQFSDAARLDERRQPASNAEQLQDEASSLSGSAIDKGSPPQSHVLEMEMTDEFAEKSPGPLFDADHTDDRNQTSSNAEQLQADPRSLGSSPTDKGPPPESRHLLKMEETDELTEKFPGQFSDAARLDERRQPASNAEQLQDEASSLSGSAIDKGSPPQSHVLEMEMTDEFAEKSCHLHFQHM